MVKHLLVLLNENTYLGGVDPVLGPKAARKNTFEPYSLSPISKILILFKKGDKKTSMKCAIEWLRENTGLSNINNLVFLK